MVPVAFVVIGITFVFTLHIRLLLLLLLYYYPHSSLQSSLADSLTSAGLTDQAILAHSSAILRVLKP